MTDEQQLTAAGNEMSASFLAAKKRSDETLAKLEAKPSSFTMLTGDRPTGRLHLGHYFGSIRERVAMQERGVNTNIIIADYQVITDRDTTEHIQDNVLNLVLDYMAAGIDPNKTMMFAHSAVPAENQLLLPFLSLVTEAELHRNHELREILYFLPVSDAEKEAFEQRFGVSLMNTYGSTESIGWVLTDPPTGARRWPSVGRAGLGYEVRITREDGTQADPGGWARSR